MTLAIVAAMQEELDGLRREARDGRIETLVRRDFVRATIANTEVVLVRSGIGKVAAACTAALLAERFRPRAMLVVGVAGAIDPALRIGDVVVATELVQHDLDARPLFPRFEVPLTGRARFESDPHGTAAARDAARAYAHDLPAYSVPEQSALSVTTGLIASGDRFIADARERAALRDALPDLLAVEMEGAAIAQVCHDARIPLTVARTISDSADANAPVDFARFVEQVAGRAARAIALGWIAAQARISV